MAKPDEPEVLDPEEEPEEDLDFEIEFYERVMERNPNAVDVLMALGDDYTKAGRYREGLAIDLKLAKLRSNDPVVHYNLACSYSLLGQVDEALETLRRAIAVGYRDFSHMQRDPDLENVRRDPRYLALLQEIVKKTLGR